MAYVRTVKTASGATAVQIVYSSWRGSRDIEHIGSAHDDAEVEVLKAAARRRLAGGQEELDLGLVSERLACSGPLPITSSRMAHLYDALSQAYDTLGFGRATGGDEVFRQLVIARVIEPTSKLDSLRVLEEAGSDPPSYRTVLRRLPVFGALSWREALAGACAKRAGLGPASLVLYDVSTLYFETDTGDGFRESGFSKERRVDPQITIGLLTDATGFPLMVNAFEGNKAETATMLPVIQAFMTAHQLAGVTVVADAGMVSEANKRAIETAGLCFILGARLPQIPAVIQAWHDEHPGSDIPDGLILTQPVPADRTGQRGEQVVYYQYRAERARRSVHGIDEQIGKAERTVAGKIPVKRNRFVTITGGTQRVNRALEEKARMLAGWKSYVSNLTLCSDGSPVTPGFIINAYHQLFTIEKSFRMSKHDLRARPIYHHQRDSIEAHLTIVFTALAVSHWIEKTTGWSIKKFVRTARRYRTIDIQVGGHTLTATDPLPDDLRKALNHIHDHHTAH